MFIDFNLYVNLFLFAFSVSSIQFSFSPYPLFLFLSFHFLMLHATFIAFQLTWYFFRKFVLSSQLLFLSLTEFFFVLYIFSWFYFVSIHFKSFFSTKTFPFSSGSCIPPVQSDPTQITGHRERAAEERRMGDYAISWFIGERVSLYVTQYVSLLISVMYRTADILSLPFVTRQMMGDTIITACMQVNLPHCTCVSKSVLWWVWWVSTGETPLAFSLWNRSEERWIRQLVKKKSSKFPPVPRQSLK